MSRRDRRKQAALDRKQQFQPEPGQTVLGCIHKPDPHGAHYYFVEGEGVTFGRPDGTMGLSHWIILCFDCADKHGEDLRDAIAEGKLLIGCDMPWPEDLKVKFVRHP